MTPDGQGLHLNLTAMIPHRVRHAQICSDCCLALFINAHGLHTPVGDWGLLYQCYPHMKQKADVSTKQKKPINKQTTTKTKTTTKHQTKNNQQKPKPKQRQKNPQKQQQQTPHHKTPRKRISNGNDKSQEFRRTVSACWLPSPTRSIITIIWFCFNFTLQQKIKSRT